MIGLTTAYFLAREGARVEVVDKGDFGQEASWAGAGILPPGDPAHARTPFDQLRSHSAALFPTLSDELRGWLRVFLRRFFGNQFKRSCLPDGPKVGSVSLSPRGDWRMPSDASAAAWLEWAGKADEEAGVKQI